MNQRIQKLAQEAGLYVDVNGRPWPRNMNGEDIEGAYQKFAELIVRECVDRVTTKANGWGDMTGFAIKESILDCAKDLKKHFGVEE